MLFARGSDEMAELRGWYRQVVWADDVARGGPALAVRALLKAPLRAARLAREGVRRYGHTATAAGVPPAKQLAALWWLQLRHGVASDTYYRYRLYAPDRRRPDRIVQNWEAARLCRLLAGDAYRDVAELLADKRRFTAWCEARDFPCVPILAELEGGRVAHAPAEGLPAVDLFTKTALGYGGTAAMRWRAAPGGGWERGGRRREAGELLAELADASRDVPVIVQRCVRNHEALAGIAGSALATVRVMTTQEPGAAPAALAAVLRLAAGGAEMDNFGQGGMVVGVDLASGRLGEAVAMDDDLRTHRHATHPDTGAPITGVALPHWRDALALAERAHAALGDYPCIGWDVAILDDGPVLLEGNWNPGVRVPQLPLPTPLGATAYPRCMNAHLRRHVRPYDWQRLHALSTWEPGRTDTLHTERDR